MSSPEPFRLNSQTTVQLSRWLEMAVLDHCKIFSVSHIGDYFTDIFHTLSKEVDGCFISDRNEAQKSLSTLAEFATWHLFTYYLQEFDNRFARSGQNNQWLSSGSPNFIDIIAMKKIGDVWRFFAIEVKWSEKCDYYGQVRGGLLDDMKKLHRFERASSRLGTHITAMKNLLAPYFDRREIEQMFSEISAGKKPSETKGIEYWGVFVSDLTRDSACHNPDRHFIKLTTAADNDSWPNDSVKGWMLNIPEGQEFLTRLAMGRKGTSGEVCA